MVILSKQLLLISCAVCFAAFGCTPEHKADISLAQPAPLVVPSQGPSSPLLLEVDLDVSAYPEAIVTQEVIIFEADDSMLKRKAYLALVALHLSRANPNQDFLSASAALGSAIDLDPSLQSNVSVQRWMDVFSLLHELQEGWEVARQLQKKNETFRALLTRQESTINELQETIEELKKIEIDVEKKRRLYR